MTGLLSIFGFIAFILIGLFWRRCVLALLIINPDTASARSRYRVVEYNSRVTSWEQARAQCRRLGMDLVKIENSREDKALKNLLAMECNNGGDGWFIGGKSENGVWRWADNSRMVYQKFPPVIQSFGSGSVRSSVVVNYAAIFQSDLQWGYVAPRPAPRMGYICEDMTC